MLSNVVQSLSCVRLFVTNPMDCSMPDLSFTISRSLLKLISIESEMPSNHLSLCHPLLLPPSIFPSIRSFFQWVSSSHHVAKVFWNFSFSVSPSNEYSGLISFRMDWFGLFAVQRTLKSLLQHHSSKASMSQCSAFYNVSVSKWVTDSLCVCVCVCVCVCGQESEWPQASVDKELGSESLPALKPQRGFEFHLESNGPPFRDGAKKGQWLDWGVLVFFCCNYSGFSVKNEMRWAKVRNPEDQREDCCRTDEIKSVGWKQIERLSL